MAQISKIKSIEKITHDVLLITLEKPKGIQYHTGQAADISINKPGWEGELRAFTFTSLPENEHLEFTIKTYPSHNGVTNQLTSLIPGDELIIGDVFGDITNKGEGVFIAGGAGITPFIAILKQLEKENKIGNSKLLFANKTKSDIICEKKLRDMLGTNFINILSNEQIDGYEHGFITEDLIKKYSSDNPSFYYLCAPPPMMEAMMKHFTNLGIPEDKIVKESF